MSPESAISMLDRELEAHGEDITLQRVGQSDLGCRAFVRNYKREEIVQGSGIVQGDRNVVLSPTEGTAAGWPLPPKVHDKCVVGAKTKTVMAVDVLEMANTEVRYELQVRG